MLNIYTKINGLQLIYDVELRFNRLLNKGERFNSELYLGALKKIDNIQFKDDDYIKTPFGNTHLNNISTGCKAVLLAIYYENTDNVVNITECGENAIELIFTLADYTNVKVFTELPFAIIKDNMKCNIDDEYVEGSEEIYRKLVINCE